MTPEHHFISQKFVRKYKKHEMNLFIEVHVVTSDCSVGYRQKICIDLLYVLYYDNIIKVAINESRIGDRISINDAIMKTADDLPSGVEIDYPSVDTIVVKIVDSNYEVEADLSSYEVSIRQEIFINR